MSGYAEFLKTKIPNVAPCGIDNCTPSAVLFDWQSAVVQWACRKGRAAIFADCGLGKTIMQLEWARQLGKKTLFVAPLAVTHQTINEATMLGMDVVYTTTPTDDQYQITNYQRLHHFVGADFGAIVLDESSILKSLGGKTRDLILSEFSEIPYRLACTATPAPNDLTELGSHAQFLGVMSWREMSATFFVKESNGAAWRIKGHAETEFYRWLSTWALYFSRPSDLGYDDDGFVLPQLSIHDMTIESEFRAPGNLFPSVVSGLSERIAVRKGTAAVRVDAAAELVRERDGQWIVWCGLNDEGRRLASALDDAVLIEGSQSDDDKVARCESWMNGSRRVLITKPSIFGFGMNFQQCSQMAFLGLGDSYEQYYQAIRRCWRFGQERPVDAWVITSDAEAPVVENVRAKEATAQQLSRSIVRHVRDFEREEIKLKGTQSGVNYATDEASGDGWNLTLGDSADELRKVESGSVGLSVFSPPFVSLYTYTATERDLGNSKDEAQFFEHFAYIIRELMRVTAPGRNCCVHVSQIAAMLVRDGYIGMKDFRAECVKAFTTEGWVYHGECVIDKDPQAQAIRTHAKGLLFAQLKRDASWLRPALADYILVFRKPGDNPDPIKPDISNDDWISWARPIWYGIKETDTLNYREARTDKDERHICPLQLGAIERCIRLWSNPGDLVCSPFAGIGSEGYMALRWERRFVGVELKPEYFNVAVMNLQAARSRKRSLFSE